MPTLDEIFAGWEYSRQIFEALKETVDQLGEVEMRVTKSQIAFRRRKALAWAWVPGRYLRGKLALLVLTLALSRKDQYSRWKEIVEPVKGRFTHHLELHSIDEIDDQVLHP